jgi:hypothetical protein
VVTRGGWDRAGTEVPAPCVDATSAPSSSSGTRYLLAHRGIEHQFELAGQRCFDDPPGRLRRGQ